MRGRGTSPGTRRRRERGEIRVSVVGPSDPTPLEARLALRVGRALATSHAILICGGLGGIMEAACRGAHEAGGMTVGILPGTEASEANRYVDLPLVTGLGEGRNLAVALTGQAVLAIGRSLGALSEVALALRHGIPVVGLGTWEGSSELGIRRADGPEDAVRLSLDLATGRRGQGPPRGRRP